MRIWLLVIVLEGELLLPITPWESPLLMLNLVTLKVTSSPLRICNALRSRSRYTSATKCMEEARRTALIHGQLEPVDPKPQHTLHLHNCFRSTSVPRFFVTWRISQKVEHPKSNSNSASCWLGNGPRISH